jgi:hydrogenase maturation factor
MKTGKISEAVLKRTVIKEIKYKNKTVKKGASVGNDGAVFKTDGRDMVSSMSTYTEKDILLCAKRAFAGAVNSTASKMADVFAVSVSILMPQSTKESELRAVMTELHDMGQSIGVQIAGGHTETSDDIEKPVITVTSYGYREKPFEVNENKGLDTGYDVVMAGEAGLEGTAVLAVENESALKERFTAGYIEKAKHCADGLVVADEAAVAVQHGGRAMHDTSKGGIFGAIWELGEYLKCGMEINLKDIPIKQETIELCEYFNLNPYFIDSLGGLLVVTDDGEHLRSVYEAMGKTAKIIGHTVSGHQKTIMNNDEKRYLESPKSGKMEDRIENISKYHNIKDS